MYASVLDFSAYTSLDFQVNLSYHRNVMDDKLFSESVVSLPVFVVQF